MKVNIGKYAYHYHPDVYADKVPFVSEKTREVISDVISPICTLMNKLFSREQKIKVRIDDWDVWSMDYTFSLIALPMLKKIKESKQGAPFVDDSDVPENIQSINAPALEKDESTDEFFFDRWDYVLDEMIWAFTQLVDDNYEEEFYSGEADWDFVDCDDDTGCSELKRGPNHTFKVDENGLKACNDRIENGLRLFGKYYRSLWT